MAKEIKKKASFGTVRVSHFSPPLGDDLPKAVNITISFEEALKLQIGLVQILGQLNGYNRATVAGRRSAVNLCLYPEKARITINEGQVREDEAVAEEGDEE